jgi:single-stranded-DNA-specific exonuclease
MRWIEPTPLNLPSSLPNLHPLVAQRLARGGFTTPEAARAFLNPDTYSPAPAADLPGLTGAVERVERAIRTGEPICVWGDFDVDGQTSTTVLVQTLLALGADVTYHIPVRGRESHGVNIPHLEEIIKRGAKLILTCDTGISAHEAVEYARRHGVDVVITDHHDLPESLPQAAAVVNPKLLPEGHPLSTLAGVGVAYKLAEALLENHNDLAITNNALLDLVALGLVADLAVLKGDARYLVQKGLAALRKPRRLGLEIMMEMAELVPANLTEEHIGFVLGPRLNALGRLGDANPAVELLTTSDPARARVLATQLENYNAQRQLLCSQVTLAAEAQLRADPALLAKPVLVLGHSSWPGGVVGIVASHLVERYGKPAILFSTPANGPAHGSARSVEGLNITAAIAAQKDLLLNFGGHPMAAGLALETANLPAFYRRLSATVDKMLGGTAREEPPLRIDAWLDLPEVSLNLAAALESLSPFGPGNEKLTLATRGLTLKSSATIGRNKEHLKLAVADEAGNTQTVLWWSGAGETLPEGKFDLAYSVRASDWRGTRQVQMEFVDFRSIEGEGGEKGEGKKAKFEIIDQRTEADPRSILEKISGHPSTIVWAEAEAKQEVGGKDRNELERADHLVIWTIPPSPEELKNALEVVQPRTVTLVGAHPFLEITEAFMARLTGLLKYAITQREGKVTYAELTAATAQRPITVESGLNWLVSRGKIALMHQEGDQLWVAAGKTINDLGGAARLWVEVQSLLSETSAYRAYFKRAEKEALFN